MHDHSCGSDDVVAHCIQQKEQETPLFTEVIVYLEWGSRGPPPYEEVRSILSSRLTVNYNCSNSAEGCPPPVKCVHDDDVYQQRSMIRGDKKVIDYPPCVVEYFSGRGDVCFDTMVKQNGAFASVVLLRPMHKNVTAMTLVDYMNVSSPLLNANDESSDQPPGDTLQLQLTIPIIRSLESVAVAIIHPITLSTTPVDVPIFLFIAISMYIVGVLVVDNSKPLQYNN